MSLFNKKHDEKKIVEKALKGDEEAYRIIFDKYSGQVYKFCYNYFKGDVSAAEDVTQEIFIKAFKNLEKLKNQEKFFPWLKRIAVNACHDYFTRNKKLDNLTIELNEKIEFGYNGFLLKDTREEEETVIHRLIEAVKNNDIRKTLTLHYVDGLTCEKVAASQNITVSAVKKRLWDFRIKNRKEIIAGILEIR